MRACCAPGAAVRVFKRAYSNSSHVFSASKPVVAVSSNQAGAAGQTLSSAAILAGQQRGLPPGVQRLLDLYHTVPVERTRCFSIIAHIDHGKSTLADKLLESTHNIWPTTKGHQQVLDTLEVERTRGITVKAQSASMIYDYTPPLVASAGFQHGVGAASLVAAANSGAPSGRPPSDGAAQEGLTASLPYLVNLIDTPGHVDFSYEVARSLAACQGALLLIDAGQGVQAQTVANFNAAVAAGLKVIPVLTKIDLAIADPEPILAALETVFGLSADDAIWTSAKTGAGVAEVLPAIIARLPPPASNTARALPLRALLFDSWFDTYRGVVCSVLVAEGVLRPGDVIVACHSGERFTVQEVGLMAPAKVAVGSLTAGGGGHHHHVGSAAPQLGSSLGGLAAGQIGYVIAGMKSSRQAQVGDTFVAGGSPASPLAGFRPAKPVVFASLYPIDSGDFAGLVTAVERLTLNDASVSVERESSTSLGFGLRCGFLGLLHMDVFHQRLQSEFETPVIITAPMVRYSLQMKDGSTRVCERAGDFPPPGDVEAYNEPTAHVSIMTPAAFLSPLLALLADRRGVQEDITYLAASSSSSSSFASSPSSAAYVEAPPSTPVSLAETSNESDANEGEGDRILNGAEDGDEEDDEAEPDDDRSSAASAAAATPAVGLTPSQLGDKVVLKYRVPWSEVVTSMYDAVKSISAGYASLDWSPGETQPADIVRVDVLLNGKPVDALCFVTHRAKAQSDGRRVCTKLRKLIDRQQFEVSIQAMMAGGKVFAKERIPPYRKNVLEKNGKMMGGGDVTRKQKLLSAQREGKKRMKTVGNVELSQEAFHALLSDK